MWIRLLPAILLAFSAVLGAQQIDSARESARERAREPYKFGLEQMQAEDYEGAAKSFQTAIGIDQNFELAHYMLGRAYLAQKRYTSAIVSLTTARNLYLAEATQEFGNEAERQRYRRERLAEFEMMLSQLRSAPQTPQVQQQIRQVEERKRQMEDLDRTRGAKGSSLVPAFVSLSLGSAQLRAGNLPEAEKAYDEAIAADPRTGEAYNNLAVVYMQTGRYDAAEQAVKNAEKTGLRVSQALKDEIRNRRQAKGSA